VQPAVPWRDGDNWLLKVEVLSNKDESTQLAVSLSRPTTSLFYAEQGTRDVLITFSCPYDLPANGQLNIAGRRELMARVAQLTNEVLKSTSLVVV
jgi:hypothetical protein